MYTFIYSPVIYSFITVQFLKYMAKLGHGERHGAWCGGHGANCRDIMVLIT